MPIREVSHFVFHKQASTSYDGSDFSWDTDQYGPRGRDQYRGHTTKTFRYDELIIRVSQVRCSPLWVDVRERKVSLEEFKWIESLKPKFNLSVICEECKLVYVLIQGSMLRQCEDEAAKGVMLGGCVLAYKDAYYATKFYIEQVESMVLKDQQFLGDYTLVNRSKYILRTEYRRPEWFTQNDQDKIVLAGTEIADTVQLFLDSKGEETFLTLKEVKVEFLRISSRENLFKMSVQSTVIFHSKFEIMVKTSERSFFKGNHTFIIPNDCYNCRLPDVGPTYCDSQLTRSYAIRFIIQFKGSDDNIHKVQSAVNINLAIPINCESVARPDNKIEDKLMTFDHALASEYGYAKPEDIARRRFDRLKNHGLKYAYHETRGFRPWDFFFTITTVRCDPPGAIKGKCSSEWLEKKKYELLQCELGFTPRYADEAVAIACKSFILEASSSSSPMLYGATVFLLGDQVFSAPLEGCIFNKLMMNTLVEVPKSLDCHRQCLNVNYISECPQHNDSVFALNLLFKIPTCLAQREGELMVLPGMKLKQFLLLQLVAETNIQDLEAQAASNFVITQIEIQLLEKIHAIARDSEILPILPYERTRSELLSEKDLDYGFSWKDFSDAGAVKVFVIPPAIYDGVLPNLGPSFFTNTFSRLYFVLVKVHVRDTNGSCNTIAQAIQQINVAHPPIGQLTTRLPPPGGKEFFYPNERLPIDAPWMRYFRFPIRLDTKHPPQYSSLIDNYSYQQTELHQEPFKDSRNLKHCRR